MPWLPLLLLLFCLNQILFRNIYSDIFDDAFFKVILPVLCVLASFVSLVLILHLRSVASAYGFTIRGLPALMATGWLRVVLCLAALAGERDVFVLASHVGMLATLSGLIVSVLLQRKTWRRRNVAIVFFFLAVLWGFRIYDIFLLDLSPSTDLGPLSYGSGFWIVLAALFAIGFRLRHQGARLQRHETQVADLLINRKSWLRRVITRRTRALNATLVVAQDRNREQTRLMAYIGHDLRAPIASIVGYAMLLRDTASAKHKKHIAAIEHDARHQLVLIDELLEHVRGEFNLFGIKPVAVNLRTLLEDISQHALTLAARQNNSFVLALREPFPQWVMLDGHRLNQVLINLISNAAKFTQNGVVTLTLAASCEGTVWTVNFKVADTGTGIAEADQERIFGRFEQAQSLDGGLGLGLFIARSIVQNMGGRLTLRSKLGVGSTFGFEAIMSAADLTPLVAGTETAAGMEDAQKKADPQPAPLMHKPSQHSLARLAPLVAGGRWTEIQDWIATTLLEQPECRDFIVILERLLGEFDFKSIGELAKPDVVHEA